MRLHKVFSAVSLASGLVASGCTTSQVLADGQLFCTAAGTLYQAGAVKVTGAQAGAVADACASITVAGQSVAGATPTAAQAGAVAVAADVAADAVAEVNASRTVAAQ